MFRFIAFMLINAFAFTCTVKAQCTNPRAQCLNGAIEIPTGSKIIVTGNGSIDATSIKGTQLSTLPDGVLKLTGGTPSTVSVPQTVSVRHVFSAAGSFTLTHNLGSTSPQTACIVNDSAAVFSVAVSSANAVTVTTDRALDLTCVFTVGTASVTQ